MNEGGGVLKCLHEVGLYSVLKERGHSAVSLKVAAVYGLVVVCVSHEYISKSFLEVGERLSKAENSHYLTCYGDHKVILPRNAVYLRAKTYGDISQRAVIGVGNSGEEYSSLVDPKLVTLLKMIVYYSAKQIVCRGYSVEVAREMEIDIVHRNDLRVSAARSAALNSENRAERGLSERDDGILADLVHSHSKTYGGRGLSLACGGGVYSGNEDKLTVRLVLCSREKIVVYFCLVFSVELKLVCLNVKLCGDLGYGKHFCFCSNLNIGLHNIPLYLCFCWTYQLIYSIIV